MKKIYLILLAVIGGYTSLSAQIGINTEFPIGILHIDGAKDNTSTNPTEAQLANDVVVTSAGNIGIGTATPITKVDLKNDPASTVSALRIQDASGTLANKVLESGADGSAFWSEQPPSITKTYVAKPSQQFLYRERARLQTTSDIVIPQNGKYLLTLRWWAYYRLRNYPTNSRNVSLYVYVVKRGGTVDLDQIEYYMEATEGQVVTFTTSLYLGDCVSGEIIDVILEPFIGGAAGGAGATWGKVHYELYGSGRPDLLPQVVLYSI